ncbi:DNA/RNA non-specific endonuclease [Microcoleus sp. D2_18a_D3]|uniref:DNA/RNA non-specific endonuclease n=1 Tax=Microcoleus sp. D2_18a_D3 TaxID=3055330 RepID=UPI002FCF846E
MKKIRLLGAIALILGMMAGCNLTSAPPSSRTPVSPKPRVQTPTAQNPVASTTNNRNLLLGNPSNAAPSVANIDNYLMVKPQFVLSYNSKTKTANWVSWQLNRSWIGAADRQDNFCADDDLADAWYKVRPAPTITLEAVTTEDTLQPVQIAPATKRITTLPF